MRISFFYINNSKYHQSSYTLTLTIEQFNTLFVGHCYGFAGDKKSYKQISNQICET